MFFYASDNDEPLHIHIERDDKVAKFWIDPIRLQKSGGFNRHEITRIHKLIEENSSKIEEVWNEYFNH